MEVNKFYYIKPLYQESSYLLAGSDNPKEMFEAQTILEDVHSPVTTRYVDALLNQVIEKGHINFGDIPNSKGNIKNYSGYPIMNETLNTMKNLSISSGATSESTKMIDTVITAVKGIESLSDLYEKGFQEKNDYIILEYNTFVYTCVQATSSLLSELVDFVKGFDKDVLDIRLKNTKYRANLFYLEQLIKFNDITAKTDYRGYLTALLNKDKNNFTGAMIVGISAVAGVAVSIIPVTRSLVYQFYRLRVKISEALALQAYFLEINKTCVEANQNLSSDKKKKIIKRQDAVRKVFIKISDKLRIENVKASKEASKDKASDDKNLSKNNNSQSSDDSPLGDLL